MKIKYYVWHNQKRIYFPYDEDGYKEAIQYIKEHNLTQKEPHMRVF